MKSLVVLVEDDPGTRELFGMVLEVEGFEVVTFETAEEALAGIAKNRPAAVVTDLTLSGSMSGIELARSLRERGVPMFAITGWDPKRLAKEDAALFTQVFLKPIDVTVVTEAIRSSLGA